MAEARVPNPLVEQFRRGGIPKDLRLVAAQGALPLKPEDLVELLLLLVGDREEEIRTTASASLAARTAEELLPIFKERSTPPAILGWGLVERKEFIRRHRQRHFHGFDVHPRQMTAMLHPLLPPRRFDENPPHRFRSGRKEMRPVFELLPSQPQPRFMHQCRGLQRMAGLLAGHPGTGELTKFFVHR